VEIFMNRRVSALVAVSLFTAACTADVPTGTSALPGAAATSKATANAEVRYIVVFQPGVRNPRSLTEELTRAFGVTPIYTYTAALSGFAAELPLAAREGIARNPNVLYIEPDAMASIVSSGSRTLSSTQWGLDRIDQQADRTRNSGYAYQNGGEGVDVYILDTGIRYSHQEFGGRAQSLYDYVSNDPIAEECQGHGTHVAGTVGGRTVGVAGAATLYGVRVLGCDGRGSYSGIIAAIDSITKRKLATPNVPMVGNMSLGGSGVFQPIIDAVERSVATGVVWAIAAGNSNANACNFSPAAAPSALTVAASTSIDARSSFSNFGACTDLFAPGSGIWSAVMTSDASYESWNGTSMAAPHVAGVAALYLAANPTATAQQVNGAIVNGATAGVIGDAMGSPNRLLYSLIAGSVASPPPPVYHPLTVTVNGNGGVSGTGIACGTAGSDCSEQVLSGSSVTLTASPSAGNVFSGWSGSCSGTQSSCTVTMLAAASVTAGFAALEQLHVGDLEGSATVNGNKSWNASFTVLVHGTAHGPIANATVSVSWSGAQTGSGSCLTGSTGQCTITRNNLGRTTSSITFRVGNVTRSGGTYTATANHDANGNSNGTNLTVTR
jgi:aqualysin 1